jgi:hypothetical protein
MGLDMYLNAERYLWAFPEDGPDAQVAQTVKGMMPELAGLEASKVQTVIAEVGYWRKANQIHNWFVNNVQEGKDECEPHTVSYKQLVDLRDVCNRVMEDNTLADTLLPTGAGFFFGGTSYDEWYYKDIERTAQVCNDVLDRFFTQKTDAGEVYSQWDIKYQSSW